MEMIALDCHKHYSVASVQTPEGRCLAERRIEHRRGSIREFLGPYSPGCPVVVETIGNWYWIVDEIEQAGKVPRLVHARKAKLMLGSINKTDKLDVAGAEPAPADGHAADGVDPAGAAAGPTRVAPDPHGLRDRPHAVKEPDSFGTG